MYSVIEIEGMLETKIVYVSKLFYISRNNTQYMPGTANTGWFGTGTTTNTYRRDPSPPSSSTYTSSGKIDNHLKFSFYRKTTLSFFLSYRFWWNYSSLR